jgi:hypothetical protein
LKEGFEVEDKKFQIVIKKRNGMMIGVAILELIIGIIFGMTGGIRSALLWIFIFTSVVTALSVFVEYSQDILLKENNIEFYKFNDVIKSIKYSSIKSIYVSKGDEPKTKKKDFLAIGFNENGKKKNSAYLINLMNYSAKDLNKIKNTIFLKNSYVKVAQEVEKLIKH